MKQPILEIKNLAVSFDTYAGEVQAVRGVSFSLQPGETLAIVGESGCGKSVSMQTIIGLLPSPPSRIKSGEILYQGEDLSKRPTRRWKPIAAKSFRWSFRTQ